MCNYFPGNQICDQACNYYACGYDGGDCSAQTNPFKNCDSPSYCAHVFRDSKCDPVGRFKSIFVGVFLLVYMLLHKMVQIAWRKPKFCFCRLVTTRIAYLTVSIVMVLLRDVLMQRIVRSTTTMENVIVCVTMLVVAGMVETAILNLLMKRFPTFPSFQHLLSNKAS